MYSMASPTTTVVALPAHKAAQVQELTPTEED